MNCVYLPFLQIFSEMCKISTSCIQKYEKPMAAFLHILIFCSWRSTRPVRETSKFLLALPSSPCISACRFKKLRYVCQPTATAPAKTLRYSSGIKAKLMAVTPGHNLHELEKLVGTVRLTCSTVRLRFSPASNACMPKKYRLKTGTKHNWLTTTLVAIERARDV